MSLTALAPVALGFAALAAAPIVVHLLTRRKVRPQPFPALEFLAKCETGRAQRRRLRDWLVLALRLLALLAAAAALAGPLWQGVLAGSNRTPAVIVLDASASMQQRLAGATAFARAKAEAGQLLDRLAPRPLALILAGAAPRRSGPEVSPTAGPARALLAEAEAGASDGDPAAAIADAARLLPSGGDIYFVTDGSAACLTGVDPATLPAGVRLRLIDAGPGRDPAATPANCGITAISCEPGVAVAGRPLTLTVRVFNCGQVPRTVGLATRVGAVRRLHRLEIPAAGSATAAHTLVPDSAGALAVSATIDGGDVLALDDQRSAVVPVLGAFTAVIAGDGDRSDPLRPVRPLVAALTAAGFQVRASDGVGLAAQLAQLGPGALAVTAGLADPAPVRLALKRHLESGGAWLHVVASDADAALAQAQAPDGIQPPVVLDRRIDISEQERGAMAIGQARLDHPLLAPFDQRVGLLTSLAASRYRLTTGSGANAGRAQAADATVLLAYADGTIALVERPVGTGRWLLVNLSPAAIDSNLASAEAFPLLIARLPAALLPARSDRLAHDVGNVVAARPGLAWQGEGDDRASAAGTTAAIEADGRMRLDRPGIWRAEGGHLLAAAVPDRESDLRPVDPATLGLAVVASSGAAEAAGANPLWPWLLALAAVACAGELLFARSLGLRRDVSLRRNFGLRRNSSVQP